VDDHLESQSICDCGFMPLRGAMPHRDGHYPIPGFPNVFVDTRPGFEVDVEAVARALSQPAFAVDAGVRVTPVEVVGSLRRWLAFREWRQARLSCMGPSDEVGRSVVPAVMEMSLDAARRYRETTIVLGDSGLAALDRPSQDDESGTGDRGSYPLVVRGFGTATSQGERLVDLVRMWDAAGRPPTGAVRIVAYQGSDRPPIPPGSFVERTGHTTFVVSP
jgi:hypothetical protein